MVLRRQRKPQDEATIVLEFYDNATNAIEPRHVHAVQNLTERLSTMPWNCILHITGVSESEATMLQIVAECLRTQRMRNPLVREVISHDNFFIVTGWPTLQPVTINSCRPTVYDFQLHRGKGNQHCTSLIESPSTCRNYVTQENTCMLAFVCASTASKTSLRVACLEHARAECAQILVAAGATA